MSGEPARPALDERLANELALGTANRLRALLLALDRLDGLEESEFHGWLDSAAQRPEELESAARELVARSLRLAADPVGYALLRLLGESGGLTAGQAMTRLGVGRVAAVERLRDLVQAGLANGEPGLGGVAPSETGRALVALVEAWSSRAAEQATATLARRR